MSEETDKPATATISHKLVNIDPPTIESKLVDCCVLNRVAVPEPASQRSPEQQRLAKIYSLQEHFRYQMYNLITDEPHNRYKHTYTLNCRPAGVWTSPKTTFCMNPRICPWCFVRQQLVPMFKALDSVPVEKRSKLRLVGWVRRLPFNAASNLRNLMLTGLDNPHYYGNAAVTVQSVVPSLKLDSTIVLGWKHCGIHFVPDDCDFVPTFIRKNAYNGHEFKVYDSATFTKVNSIYDWFTSFFGFNWFDLFDKKHFSFFQRLITKTDKQRFVRINKYKGV